jgi:ABC-2 type transport system permease protein
MNPTIRKELRSRMRERRGWILPSLYLLTLAAVISLAYFFSTFQAGMEWRREIQGAEVGIAIFLTVAFTQLALLLLMAPVFSAGAITVEKEHRTLPSLITSLLTPFEIWWGKFTASLLFVMLLLVASLPALALAFALGGVGPREILVVFLTTVAILASISSTALYFSSFFRRSVHSTAVSYAAVVALTVVTPIIYVLAAAAWGATHTGVREEEMPGYISAPLYLNPFVFLSTAFAPIRNLYPDWIICLVVAAVIGGVAAALAVRNIARSGETV